MFRHARAVARQAPRGALGIRKIELKSLDLASQLPPEYPGWMFARQNMDRFPGGAIK